jgi:hypothetical protein
VADDREIKRYRKRFSVGFGIGKIEKTGFTDDISAEGLFIRSSIVAPPGSIIMIEIMQPKGVIALLGEVMWVKRIPPNILHRLKGGMGIRIKSFQSGEEIYQAVCDELAARRGA